ncbi:MAG: SDR family oxidoreductase [Cyclobacteriaceae bacterium]|nr:SDR family oxidoreductase [Cyclobacteriaceae bacterium]
MNRKIAIVTGVSRLKGIGREICCELAKIDFDIFFTYWTEYDQQMPWKANKNEPILIHEEIRELGVKCEKLELDLSKKNAIEILFSEVKNRLGFPLVLVNNAAYSTQTTIDSLTASELNKHYEINLKATTLLTIEFVKQFNFSKNGRIINLSSGQSLGQMSNEIAYAITKGGIETLTCTLSQEIASKGITINSVNPGPNDTGWMDKKMKRELLNQFPMGRIGTPKDTAKLIGFLASEDAEWITGQIIHSEGGFKR